MQFTWNINHEFDDLVSLYNKNHRLKLLVVMLIHSAFACGMLLLKRKYHLKRFALYEDRNQSAFNPHCNKSFYIWVFMVKLIK